MIRKTDASWILSAVLLCMASCASNTKPSDLGAETTDPVKSTTSNIFPSTGAGVELRSWATRASSDDFSATLAPYEQAAADRFGEVASRWEKNGLRLVLIPLDETAAVVEKLIPQSVVNARWLGQPAAWTQLVAGPEFHTARLFRISNAPLDLKPGALRILIRDWVVPTPALDKLHLELAFQHVAHDERNNRRAPFQSRRLTEEERGHVFRTLTSHLSLAPGEALLIIPESPEQDWEISPARDAPDSGSTSAPANELDPNQGSTNATHDANPSHRPAPAGPAPPRLPTLGDALLSLLDTSDPTGDTPRRVILLVPRIPKRFQLLP